MATNSAPRYEHPPETQLQLLDAEGAEHHRLHGLQDTVLIDPDGCRVEILLGRSSSQPLLVEPSAEDSPPSFVVRQEAVDGALARLDQGGPGFLALGRQVSPQFEFGADVGRDHCLLRVECGALRIIDYSVEGTTVIIRVDKARD
jgi:hypothetical protein